MTRQELFNNILIKKSFLCIGLDTDITKIPKHLLKHGDPVFEFNKHIIDATKDLCIAYKPNIAFYEYAKGGWECLEKTLALIPSDILKIADAKRGDIGNSSKFYAKTFFETYNFDAVTVAPYMGRDSVAPFLNYKNKWTILLALTSNEGALDFQLDKQMGGSGAAPMLFEKVLFKSKEWGSPENLMYVIGANRAEMLTQVRKIVPDHFLLIPGIGAQGGNLSEVAGFGMKSPSSFCHCLLLD